MDEWRTRAIAMFPGRAAEFADVEETGNGFAVFFCLLMDWQSAAGTNDEGAARKIIEYADWARGGAGGSSLAAAADAAFLEHIADDDHGLALAERLFPSELYERAMSCSAALKRNVAGWGDRLATSQERYRGMRRPSGRSLSSDSEQPSAT